MKKLLVLSLLFITPTFAQEIEPNFYDISDTYASLQRIRSLCPSENPVCADICTQGISYSLDQLKSGGNVSASTASSLSSYWNACSDSL